MGQCNIYELPDILYVGCYNSLSLSKVFTNSPSFSAGVVVDVKSCISACGKFNSSYIALDSRQSCSCGTSVDLTLPPAPYSDCKPDSNPYHPLCDHENSNPNVCAYIRKLSNAVSVYAMPPCQFWADKYNVIPGRLNGLPELFMNYWKLFSCDSMVRIQTPEQIATVGVIVAGIVNDGRVNEVCSTLSNTFEVNPTPLDYISNYWNIMQNSTAWNLWNSPLLNCKSIVNFQNVLTFAYRGTRNVRVQITGQADFTSDDNRDLNYITSKLTGDGPWVVTAAMKVHDNVTIFFMVRLRITKDFSDHCLLTVALSITALLGPILLDGFTEASQERLKLEINLTYRPLGKVRRLMTQHLSLGYFQAYCRFQEDVRILLSEII
jgi:hypothetical protein